MVGESDRSCRFTIPMLPPSVNSLHQIIWHQRKVELKPEVMRWKSDAKQYIPRFRPTSEVSLVCVDIVFHYRFHTNKGTLRVYDTHNAVKPLIDVIAEKQGWNDKQAKRGKWNSVNSEREFVEVVLTQVE